MPFPNQKHKVNNPAYNDHFTDIYLVCQRVPEEAIELVTFPPFSICLWAVSLET